MWFHDQVHTCIHLHVYGLNFKIVLFQDPPAITAIDITEVCINDVTVSWTTASNEEELSYVVTLFPPDMMSGTATDAMIDTSYNLTGLMPETTYNVSVATTFRSTSCVGNPNTILVTTLTLAAAEPESELIIMNMNL